jgi:excisionase family DNA binding protein
VHSLVEKGEIPLLTYERPSEWLDLSQADREGPFSKRTLWALIAAGRLPAYQPSPRKTLIKREDLNALIESTRISADQAAQ